MNEIRAWNYHDHIVRIVQKDGEPWFVLSDVCKVLELSTPTRVAERLDEDEVSQTHTIDKMGRTQKSIIINESGLYNVILRSDKPQAKPFRKWVTSEVLPAIRKTGKYEIDSNMCYAPTRPLTTDDYMNAAKTIAKCHNSRLPMVIDLYRKAGLDVACIQQEQLPIVDDVDLVELLQQYSLRELCTILNLAKSTVYGYRSGKVTPHRERKEFIVKTLVLEE